MKYNELAAITNYLEKFHYLKHIERVDDNVLRATFDGGEIFFDLNRSNNLIYKRDDFVKTKSYNAPFDKVLQKRCTKSRVIIELNENDKILKIECHQQGAYKESKAILLLEFTGRLANAIIIDNNGKVLEALHHDFHRDLKPGRVFYPLEAPKKLNRSPLMIEDMDKYLHKTYQTLKEKRLTALKSAKVLQLSKQKEKVQKLLNSLAIEEELQQEANDMEKRANVILANLHQIKPYQKEFEGFDFDGQEVCFELPKEAKSPSHMVDLFFKQARKLRQKAENIHLQRENLLEKLNFLEQKECIVKNAKRVEDIELLFPKSKRAQSKKDKNYEKYIVDGYPVYVGKNRQGNIELLKKAKASDIWFHLKDIPSAHVIVATKKQNLPDHIIKSAAELCAKFSVKHPGRYLVDYTQRRNVKPKEGANVEYVKYKTTNVTI